MMIMYKFVLFSLMLAAALGTPLNDAKQRNIGARIVGGHDTTIEENPWMASIQLVLLEFTMCGGVIIGEDTILTAASCSNKDLINVIQVAVGGVQAYHPDQLSNIDECIVHEKYDKTTHDYDVALCKLSTKLTFNDKVQPIKLPVAGTIFPTGFEVNVTGWGAENYNDDVPVTNLQLATVGIIDHDACKDDYSDILPITDRMLCAGLPAGGKDACRYDAGGPLSNDGSLVGIVSWNENCALPEYPGVYTDIGNGEIREWIKEHSGI